MECPYCESNQSNVIDSRKVEMNVFRTRICKKCGSKFYTEEVAITEEEAKEKLKHIMEQVDNITWTGWVIKSAIKEWEEI